MRVSRVYVIEFTHNGKGFSFVCDRSGNPQIVTIQYLKCKEQKDYWMEEVRAIEVVESEEKRE